jgi:Fe-S-cluster containining protein
MSKFYKNGLYFECTVCGECCRHSGGKVEITPIEALKIASALDMAPEEFLREYCHQENGSIELIDNENGYCIFLMGDRCSIYDSRPLQCRTFPFWRENLKSHYRWKQLRSFCPGIDRGELYSPESIRQKLSSQKRLRSQTISLESSKV